MENQDQNKSFPTWALILAIFIGICITAFVYKLKLEPEDSVNTETQAEIKELRKVKKLVHAETGIRHDLYHRYHSYYDRCYEQARKLAIDKVKKESFDYELTECERQHKPKKDYCERCKDDIEYRDRRLKRIENGYNNDIKIETENIINHWKKNGKMFDPKGKETCLPEHIIGKEKLKEIKKIAKDVCSEYNRDKVPKTARELLIYSLEYDFYYDSKTNTIFTVCCWNHEKHVENKLKELILPLVTKDLIIKNMHIDKDIRKKIQESDNLYIMIKFDCPKILTKTLEKTLELEIYY